MAIEFGTGIRTVTDIATAARRIEALGFDIVSAGEHNKGITDGGVKHDVFTGADNVEAQCFDASGGRGDVGRIN